MVGITTMLTAQDFDGYVLGVVKHRLNEVRSGNAALTVPATSTIEPDHWNQLLQRVEAEGEDEAEQCIFYDGDWAPQCDWDALLEQVETRGMDDCRFLEEAPAERCRFNDGGWVPRCTRWVPEDQLVDGLCADHAAQNTLSRDQLDELDQREASEIDRCELAAGEWDCV